MIQAIKKKTLLGPLDEQLSASSSVVQSGRPTQQPVWLVKLWELEPYECAAGSRSRAVIFLEIHLHNKNR